MNPQLWLDDQHSALSTPSHSELSALQQAVSSAHRHDMSFNLQHTQPSTVNYMWTLLVLLLLSFLDGMAENDSTYCDRCYHGMVCSDISVSKINLVYITILCVTGFSRFYCISVLKYFSVSVSIVSLQIIFISVSFSVFISISGLIILINKSITLILEL